MSKLERWKRQSNYMGEDFSDYFVVLGINRDSNTLDRSNFVVALERLEHISHKEGNLIAPRFSHWGVGWIELIMVREGAEALIEVAEDIVDALNEYPVLDEEHWGMLQWEEAVAWWDAASEAEKEWVWREYGRDDEGEIPYDFVATF